MISNSTQFKENYNTQKFPGFFILFNGNTLTGSLMIFNSGKINSVGIKRPQQFLELDKWIKSNIHYV